MEQELSLTKFIGIYDIDDFEEFIKDLIANLNDESDIMEFELVDYDLVGDDDWFVSIKVSPALSISDRLWFDVRPTDKFYRDINSFIMDVFGLVYIGEVEVKRDENELIIARPKTKLGGQQK